MINTATNISSLWCLDAFYFIHSEFIWKIIKLLQIKSANNVILYMYSTFICLLQSLLVSAFWFGPAAAEQIGQEMYAEEEAGEEGVGERWNWKWDWPD